MALRLLTRLPGVQQSRTVELRRAVPYHPGSAASTGRFDRTGRGSQWLHDYGGDPLEQSEELALLLPELRKISGDILVYTGYTLEQLRAMDSPAVESVLRNTSVLIDGEYIQRRNTGLPLRGSDNQRIIYLDESLRARYEEYISGGSGIQDFPAADGMVSVGIHRPDYPQELERRLAEKSIIKCDTEENGNDGA